MWYSIKLIFESSLVGLISVASISIVRYVYMMIQKYVSVNKENDMMNRVLESNFIVPFISGFFTHLAYQFMGFNYWYCRHGVACRQVVRNAIKSK